MDRANRKITSRVATSLTQAACEWFLIFLMLVDGLLSYLLVWFTHYCRLQLPCFFCSKLHRHLHLRLLLCKNHRSVVSSSISCQIHDSNLGDGRCMCDECVLSFSAMNDPSLDSVHTKPYSSHHKPRRSRHSSQRSACLGFPAINTMTKPNIPAPRMTTSRRGNGNLKKMKDQKVSAQASGMAPAGYTELKITSDSDSDFPFSDYDSFVPITDFNSESSPKNVKESLSEGLFGDKSTIDKIFEFKDHHNENTVAEASMAEPNYLDDFQQQSVQEGDNANSCFEYRTLVDEDKEETELPKENDDRDRTNSSASDRIFMNTHGTTNSPDRRDSDASPRDVSSPKVREKALEPKESDVSERFTSYEATGSPANDGVNGEAVAKEHSSDGKDRVNGDCETLTSNNVLNSGEDEFNDDPDALAANNVSASVNDDPDALAATTVTIEHSSKNNISNEATSVNHRDKEAHSALNEAPELKHSASVESFGSSYCDLEGESLVDRLKQQIEHDKKCLNDLHKELDEERNASAIAANQAMAMITRLQEEKAALHMEALQYLRMMDEQAEHDVDTLEKANDLLADKEKEIQDLEMELEYYRLKFPDEPRDEILAFMGISADSATEEQHKGKIPTDTKARQNPNFTGSSAEIEKERLDRESRQGGE